MKPYAKEFYTSAAWQQCREAYAKSKKYLCENCLQRGLLTPGEIVHHKINITPENINNPEITLNFKNLRLVCRKCHAEEHKQRDRRYYIDEDGKVFIKADE